MTQKELSYVEDAVGHEENIIKILNESVNSVDDEEIISFLKKKIEKHISLKDKLMDILEDKSNEWSTYNG